MGRQYRECALCIIRKLSSRQPDQSEGFLKALQREGDIQVAASKGQLRVARNWSWRGKKEISSWSSTGRHDLCDSDGARVTLCDKVRRMERLEGKRTSTLSLEADCVPYCPIKNLQLPLTSQRNPLLQQ